MSELIKVDKSELLANYERFCKHNTVSPAISELVDYLDKEVEYLWSVTIKKRNEEILKLRTPIEENDDFNHWCAYNGILDDNKKELCRIIDERQIDIMTK